MEGYNPSETEIKDAEAMLDREGAKQSSEREKSLEKLKGESGLDEETFEEVVKSFEIKDSEEFPGVKECHFTVKGQKITLLNALGTFTGAYVDGVEVEQPNRFGDANDEFTRKYFKCIAGLIDMK